MGNFINIRPLLLILLLSATIGCKTENKVEASVTDSISVELQNPESIANLVESNDSLPDSALPEESYNNSFINLDQFLVKIPLDTSEFQLITKTCAIVIERTQADIKQLEEFEEQEKAEREARREKMSAAELAHDDSVREEEEWIMGDDGAYYESLKVDGLETIDNLKIKRITAQDKSYLKLINANKKEWVLDIRSAMQQGWTAVFFNIKKEPKVIELTNVNREVVVQYFFQD